mgnify:CR=1 FL=1
MTSRHCDHIPAIDGTQFTPPHIADSLVDRLRCSIDSGINGMFLHTCSPLFWNGFNFDATIEHHPPNRQSWEGITIHHSLP